MNHNEIVGWEKPDKLLKDFVAVFLRDKDDFARISSRMDITKRLIESEGFKTIEVTSSGRTLLARIFSLIYTGDFVSLYLAILNKRDPTPVKRITYLKKELAKS
jgi:glucose/mannose-6-phosphate isomerase